MPHRLLPIALLIAVSLSAVSQVAQPAKIGRALPLNRFPASRATQTDAQGFYAMPVAVGDDYFDGTSSPERVERHLQAAQELGARYLRCAFSWNAIETVRGERDWLFWDRLVDAAEKHGIELIPYVAYTPEWAASEKEAFWTQPPSDPQLYAGFMREAAQRYRGRIRSWELWNEPDNREYWRGSPHQFAELLERAASAIRAVDPEAVLVLGGMSLGPGEFFQALMRDEHVDRYVDVIAMHAYPETWGQLRTERQYRDWIAGMQRLIEEGGTGVDLWANEMGYADYRFKPNQASKYLVSVIYAYEHTADFAATSLFKSETLALASGKVSLTGWYRIDDFPASETRLGDDLVNFHLGLTDPRGKPKPAFAALKFFHQVLGGPAKLITANTPDDQAIVDVFAKRNGHVVLVAWLRSSEPDEVADHSGMAQDRRRERLAVKIPCRGVSETRAWDEQGRPISNSTTFQRGSIVGIPVSGEHVFVAEMACAR